MRHSRRGTTVGNRIFSLQYLEVLTYVSGHNIPLKCGENIDIIAEKGLFSQASAISIMFKELRNVNEEEQCLES